MTINVGDILFVTGLDIYKGIDEPPDKYCVVVALNPYKFFLVNSKNRESYDCIPFLKNGRKFPDYDSFISCNTAFELSTKSKIIAKRHYISTTEMLQIYEKVKNSRILTKIDKQPLMASLETALRELNAFLVG